MICEGQGLLRALLAEIDDLTPVAASPAGSDHPDDFGKPSSADDPINPPHYNAGSPYETIKVMLEWFGVEPTIAFCHLNAVKYLSRMGKKGSAIEDVRKAEWYCRTAARLMEEQGQG